MRTKIVRIAPAVVAATVLTLSMAATPAQAHAVAVANSTVWVGINASHTELDVCRTVGTGSAWATVRYANPSGPGSSLVRYDAQVPGATCAGYRLGPNVNAIRACETRSTGNNCSRWEQA